VVRARVPHAVRGDVAKHLLIYRPLCDHIVERPLNGPSVVVTDAADNASWRWQVRPWVRLWRR
jgi:hypothetical protein